MKNNTVKILIVLLLIAAILLTGCKSRIYFTTKHIRAYERTVMKKYSDTSEAADMEECSKVLDEMEAYIKANRIRFGITGYDRDVNYIEVTCMFVGTIIISPQIEGYD